MIDKDTQQIFNQAVAFIKQDRGSFWYEVIEDGRVVYISDCYESMLKFVDIYLSMDSFQYRISPMTIIL